jgi:hypothetical protein
MRVAEIYRDDNMILICLLLAWSISIGLFAAIVIYSVNGFKYVRQLHQIPCSKCQYFADSRYLKCTVNPDLACSEEAISCRDFNPKPSTHRQQQARQKTFVHNL